MRTTTLISMATTACVAAAVGLLLTTSPADPVPDAPRAGLQVTPSALTALASVPVSEDVREASPTPKRRDVTIALQTPTDQPVDGPSAASRTSIEGTMEPVDGNAGVMEADEPSGTKPEPEVPTEVPIVIASEPAFEPAAAPTVDPAPEPTPALLTAASPEPVTEAAPSPVVFAAIQPAVMLPESDEPTLDELQAAQAAAGSAVIDGSSEAPATAPAPEEAVTGEDEIDPVEAAMTSVFEGAATPLEACAGHFDPTVIPGGSISGGETGFVTTGFMETVGCAATQGMTEPTPRLTVGMPGMTTVDLNGTIFAIESSDGQAALATPDYMWRVEYVEVPNDPAYGVWGENGAWAVLSYTAVAPL